MPERDAVENAKRADRRTMTGPDIVKRLRDAQRQAVRDMVLVTTTAYIVDEAADEIERLREALKRIAGWADNDVPADMQSWEDVAKSCIRDAREALRE